jgi:hypothetical protein
MAPTTPERALAAVMTTLGPRTLTYISREPPPAAGSPLSDVHRVERALLEPNIIVPVVHAPELYGLGERLDSRNGPVVNAIGEWNLADVWLRAGAP